MTEQELTPVPDARLRYDDEGRPIVDVVTCGTCGRSWNDAAISSWTPAPSGRCPFEYEHEEEPEVPRSANVRKFLDLSTAHLPREILESLPELTVAYPTEYGALLWVPEDLEDYYGGLDQDIPEELRRVVVYARELDCDYILFDSDALIDDNLPTFEW